MIANYHSIETFSGVDGPGIRYVLFLQGCNLRCKYCHNADTIPNIKNKSITVDEVVKDYLKYASFYIRGGGITISGGEPLMQIDFIISLFTELKKYNVHTCIETQGTLFRNNDKFKALIDVTDLFIVDLKGVNDESAKFISGQGIEKTLAFLDYLNKNQRKFQITYVVLPGINDRDEDALALGKILNNYDDTYMSFIALPYRKFGVDKWNLINIRYMLMDLPEPSKGDVVEFVNRVKNARGK